MDEERVNEKRVNEERIEDCVVLWDTCAWVACTVEEDFVAQGRSPLEAVKRLQSQVTMTEILREHFENADHSMLPALPRWRALFKKTTEQVSSGESDRSKIYRGQVRHGLQDDRRRQALAYKDV